MCMCICMCLCLCRCTCRCMCICKCICICRCRYVCTYVFVFVLVYVYIHMHMYICIYIRKYTSNHPTFHDALSSAHLSIYAAFYPSTCPPFYFYICLSLSPWHHFLTHYAVSSSAHLSKHPLNPPSNHLFAKLSISISFHGNCLSVYLLAIHVSPFHWPLYGPIPTHLPIILYFSNVHVCMYTVMYIQA